MPRKRKNQGSQGLSKRRGSRDFSQTLQKTLSHSTQFPRSFSPLSDTKATSDDGLESEDKSEAFPQLPACSTSRDLLDVSGEVTPACLRLNSKGNPRAHSVQTGPCQLPESSVLQKVKSFLPMMHEADTKLRMDLASLPVGSLDIENVDDTPGHVVAMDLMLFEHSSSDSDTDDENSLVAKSDRSSNDSDTTSVEELDIAGRPVTEENFRLSKPSKQRRAPVVEVVQDDS